MMKNIKFEIIDTKPKNKFTVEQYFSKSTNN